jgi:hypothetical protein
MLQGSLATMAINHIVCERREGFLSHDQAFPAAYSTLGEFPTRQADTAERKTHYYPPHGGLLMLPLYLELHKESHADCSCFVKELRKPQTSFSAEYQKQERSCLLGSSWSSNPSTTKKKKKRERERETFVYPRLW